MHTEAEAPACIHRSIGTTPFLRIPRILDTAFASPVLLLSYIRGFEALPGHRSPIIVRHRMLFENEESPHRSHLEIGHVRQERNSSALHHRDMQYGSGLAQMM